MVTQSETRRIQTTLKAIIKSQRHSYSELARELAISVPTVKRIFSNGDISIERLTRICGVLGIQLHELLELTRSDEVNLYSLSPVEEAFFAKNPPYLYYLHALQSERLTPSEIEKGSGISRRSTQKYLARLSSMGLVRVLGDGRVKILIQGLIGWDDHGVLGKVLSHDQIRGIVERNLSGTAIDPYLELSGRTLLPEEYEAMKKEFREIVVKYRRISKVNSASKDLKRMRRYSTMVLAEREASGTLGKISELSITQ